MEKGNKLRAAIVLTTALALGGAACGSDRQEVRTGAERTTTTFEDNVTSPTNAPEACEDTWEMTGLDHAGHRVVAEGVPSIGTASNEDEARDAVADWLDLAKKDAGVLKGVAKTIAGEDVSTSELKDSEDCATEEAEDLVGEIEGVLASAEMAPADVPEDATNSGMNDDGEFVQADHEGISGDRRSIEVTINDVKIWIMKRCGNIGKRGHIPGVPKGPTDETGMTPKIDGSTSPANVPGANPGSQTSDHGPTGPGGNSSHPNGGGFDPNEEPVTAPPEQPVTTDPDSPTGTIDNGGSPNTAPPTTADINHGDDGGQGGNIGGGGGI